MFVVRGRRIWIWIARNGDGFSILMSPIEIKKARQCGGTAESEARTEQAREYVGRSEGFACTFARRAAILGWASRKVRNWVAGDSKCDPAGPRVWPGTRAHAVRKQSQDHGESVCGERGHSGCSVVFCRLFVEERPRNWAAAGRCGRRWRSRPEKAGAGGGFRWVRSVSAGGECATAARQAVPDQ